MGAGVSRTAVAVFLPLTLVAVVWAQQATPPGWNDPSSPMQIAGQIPTLRTGVQLVVQDITVMDAAGHPVTGLTPEDFHIFEDGREQTIKSFEEKAPVDPVLAKERADALAHALPPNTFTNYKAFSGGTVVVFLLDTVDAEVCSQMRTRLYMIEYMKTVPLGTPYIVMQLDTGLHMVQDMTTDIDALRSAIHGKRDFPEFPPQVSSDDPRFPSYVAAQRRRQIVTGAMKELTRYLGAIPGRKNLVWFSEGLGGKLAMIDPSPSVATNVAVDVGAFRISTDPRSFPDPSQETYSAPQGANVDLPTGPIGMPPPEMKGNPTFATYLGGIRDSLAQSRIGLNTVGIGCLYQFGVPEQIAAIVDQGAHYYRVSYTPTNQNWNGQARKVSVELADKTLRLDYRTSYLGKLGMGDMTIQRVETPVQTAAASAVLHNATGPSPTLQTAMGMGTVEPTQVIFEASATPAATETKDGGSVPAAAGNFLAVKLRKQGYRDYTLHYRVRANELKLIAAPDGKSYSGKLEFVAVLYDNQGQAVNGKRERASVSFANLTDPQIERAELTGDLSIQVPTKGNYFLRLGVRDTATDRVGALEIPVDRIPLPRK
jgi:VWFA-related protein